WRSAWSPSRECWTRNTRSGGRGNEQWRTRLRRWPPAAQVLPGPGERVAVRRACGNCGLLRRERGGRARDRRRRIVPVLLADGARVRCCHPAVPRQAVDLVRALPRVRILATSRP